MIMGKIWQLVEKPAIPYDTIIVDMPATGHAVALLDGANVVCKAVQIGPLKMPQRESADS
jgi:anion-transporting  ArsA/GET3 family ATPase